MQKKISPVLIVIALIIVVIIAGGITFLMNRYKPTTDRADSSQYFGVIADDETTVVINGEILEDKGKIIDGKVYLSEQMVGQYINSRFYWDIHENKMLYTTATEIIEIDDLQQIDGAYYIALDFIKEYTDMLSEDFVEPQRTVIFTPEKLLITGKKDSEPVEFDISILKQIDDIDSKANLTSTLTPLANVSINIDNELYIVEVDEIETSEDGSPCITIYSSAISAAISDRINTMVPFVPCALLENNEIVDPRYLGAGVLLPNGEISSAFKSIEASIVIKDTSLGNAFGSWPDGIKGYLSFAFDTSEPIKDIIIGTYADYSTSNYKEFLSSGVSSK